MSLGVSVGSSGKGPMGNDFSIDVAGQGDVRPSSLTSGVMSGLLLASSLGKCIRSPKFCFLHRSTQALHSLSFLVVARN